MPLTPNNREEHWLQGMVDGQTTLEPNKRREFWYKEIVDAIGSGGGGGAGGGVLVVGSTLDADVGSITLDKTWEEIHDAPFAVIHVGKKLFYITEFTGYDIITYSSTVRLNFAADGPDEYPVGHGD